MTKSESYIRNSLTSFVGIIVNFILKIANEILKFSLVLILVYFLELCIFEFFQWIITTSGNTTPPKAGRSETHGAPQLQDEINKIPDELLDYDLPLGSILIDRLNAYQMEDSDTYDITDNDVPSVQNSDITSSLVGNVSNDDIPSSTKHLSSLQENFRDMDNETLLEYEFNDVTSSTRYIDAFNVNDDSPSPENLNNTVPIARPQRTDQEKETNLSRK